MNEKDWSFVDVWNKSLLNQEIRPTVARDHIWASELGKAPIELYLKLKGVEPTNPPNARSLRKFEAGNVFEWIVSLILKRAGILQESQKWTAYQYPDLLKVTGKMDFIAGGLPDYEKARFEMNRLELPEVFVKAGTAIMEHFEREYPNGLKVKPLEIKSVSVFMFELLEKKGTGSQNHRMQLMHYLLGENFDSGNIIYICRDDLRMLDIPVVKSEKTESEYRDCLVEITKYVREDVRPPLEKPIVFDKDIGKFSKNWNVAYSNYLTMLYGYQNQKEFDDAFSKIAERWNRVVNRVKRGDKMTEKNLLVLDEIKNADFNLEGLLKEFEVEGESEEVN